ncbi:hypothetical protein H0H93_005303 [Arthromyces matolae]|nr:hypothetical protein H0H93_005303 [Arthromyces matolae]
MDSPSCDTSQTYLLAVQSSLVRTPLLAEQVQRAGQGIGSDTRHFLTTPVIPIVPVVQAGNYSSNTVPSPEIHIITPNNSAFNWHVNDDSMALTSRGAGTLHKELVRLFPRLPSLKRQREGGEPDVLVKRQHISEPSSPAKRSQRSRTQTMFGPQLVAQGKRSPKGRKARWSVDRDV